MEGGAWNSGVYETAGRDGQKAKVPPAQGRAAAMEAGTPTPALYNPTPKEAGKDSRTIGVVTVVLRSLLVVFTLITFALMAASNQKITDLTSLEDVSLNDPSLNDPSTSALDDLSPISGSFSVKFTDIHSFVGLLSVTIIVCVYSVVQLVLCVVHVLSTGAFITSVMSGVSLITFIFDSVLAYLLIAAAGAAADYHATMKDEGLCDALSKFCGTTSGSIAMAFIAFTMLAACAALFPARLYKMSLSR